MGEGQLTLTKFLLLTDTPQDLKDFRSLFEHILERVDWHRDLHIFSQTAFDTLDYASGKVNFGSKAIMMCVGDAKRELEVEFSGELPVGISKAEPYCRGCLVVEATPYENDKTLAERIVNHDAFADWQMVIVHDSIEFARDTDKFLWATWTRFDPASDIYARTTELKNNHIGHNAPIVIDCRMKPWYPKVVEVRDDIEALVDNRWSEYFG